MSKLRRGLISYRPWILALLIGLSLAVVSNAGAATSLVSHWPGEGDAKDAADGNDGTLVGDTTFATGQVGQAFSFDGAGDHVSIPDPGSFNLDITGSITMTAWFRSDSSKGGMIFSKDNLSNPRTGYALHVNPNSYSPAPGSVAVNCFGSRASKHIGANSVLGNTTNYNDGVFHHVAGVCDVSGDGRARLYIDGVLIATSPTTMSSLGTNNVPLTLGNRGRFPLPINGLIDEACIFASALSPTEVTEVMNNGCSPPPDSDGDGVPDDQDAFPNSNLDATVDIGGCDSSVDNLELGNGATFNDMIGAAAAGAKNHGAFVSAVSKLANQWKKDGLISGKEKGKITSCAARSDLP